ncbi:MAG: hypothetical protein PHP02_00300 [Eubacteriales bacterium]|nr:hypothetical protein [Eubacteriales bacterium]
MKKIAITLAVIALLLSGAALWGVSQATLKVEIRDALTMPADTQPAEFERLMALLDHNALRGTVFDSNVTGNPADYTILRYTLRVRNNGLIPAKMLETLVVPVSGDVLCYSQQDAQGQDVNQPLILSPSQEMDLHCYLLTRRELHPVRELRLTYYVWGHPFLVKVTYG